MNSNNFTLETERLTLRPYEATDAQALHAIWTSPGVRRYLFDDETVPLDWVRTEIESSRQSFETRGFGQWAIREKGAQEIAGFCGYRDFHEPPETQLLYGLAESAWSKGFATEAAGRMIDHAFEALNFPCVVASTDGPNGASIRVMERCGLVYDRTVVNDGAETVYYALKREDWAA